MIWLETLHLDGNQISDLKPLAGLKSLEILGLGDNRVKDLTPLTGIIGWKALYLDRNQITDLTPLTSMAQKDQQGTKRFTPWWTVSSKGNPLSAMARSQDLPVLKKFSLDVLDN